ncbi:winged helix-turn-helix transcriptional regulator [Sorangium sp. So ce131]|uniref:winged helix-turn-helix transcriptional regulator n=1 Tax=Sorangium sp. So ce131 TaxID=3133282 RepID=UPI003F6313C8
MKHSSEHLCEKFQAAMDVLARPWNGLIIATLEGGALRFGEIGERLDAISDRMLSSRLKELEALGLLVRRVLPGPPVRVEYELTDVGRGFHDVATAISRWGELLTAARSPRGGAKGTSARRAPKEQQDRKERTARATTAPKPAAKRAPARTT